MTDARSAAPSAIRIAVDGGPSTGKTTLAQDLRNEFGDQLVVLVEASRAVSTEFGIHRTSDWDALHEDPTRLESFFNREEEWQLAAEQRSEHVVADGSLLQIRAYRGLLSRPRPIEEVAARYQLILYCAIDAGLANDGFRDLRYRQAIDDWYRRNVLPLVADNLLELPNTRRARRESALHAVEHLLGQSVLRR